MTTQRFNGVPIKVDRLTDAEAAALHEATLQRVVRGFGELTMSQAILDERGLTHVPAEADDGQLTLEFEGGEL